VLEQELDTALAADRGLVVVDLRELEFIDSTGIGLLVKAHRQAHDSGREFGLVNGTAQVERLLKLTGLSERLTVVDTVEELLAGD
jgi:anti-anti-sigma factor